MHITPAVLATTLDELRAYLEHPVLAAAGRAHIDILDRSLFGATRTADPRPLQGDPLLSRVPLELHLMVRTPLPHLIAWTAAGARIDRVLLHTTGDDLLPTLRSARAMGARCSHALAHGDPLPAHFSPDIDELLVMGVAPGAMGRPFLGEPILALLRRLTELFPRLGRAVDGGVNAGTIAALAAAGTTRCIVGSALWKEEDPLTAFTTLCTAAETCAILSK